MLTAFCRSALVTGAYLEGSVSVHNPIMAQLENFRSKVFRASTEHLNFHKSAGRLFLTHPSVTLQIKARESGPGVRLFDCAGENVSLTR